LPCGVVAAAADYLFDMVGHMSKETGLVLQMPFCCDRKGFAGIYEKVNSQVILVPSPWPLSAFTKCDLIYCFY